MIKNPILVIGSGRSGTTLLAKLIDSSPQILYRHEPDKILPTDKIPYLEEDENYYLYLKECRLYIEKLLNQKHPFCNSKRPIFNKSFRSGLNNTLLKFLTPLYSTLDSMHIHLNIPDFISTNNPKYLIKSVNSIVRAPMFSRAMPEMKIIQIVRHPGAVISSLLNGIETNKMNKFDFVNAVSQLKIATNYPFEMDKKSPTSFEEKTAYTWMIQNEKVYTEMKDNKKYMLVSYEYLCLNMETCMKEIFDFIGLEYHAQTKLFIDEMNKATSDSGYFSVIKNPTEKINKWEYALNQELINIISTMIKKSEIGSYVLSKYPN